MRSKKTQLTILGLLLVSLAFVVTHKQAITDRIRLAGYEPSRAVTELADQDTMTGYARHLFYVNHPLIESGADFTKHCPNSGEKTVVLGCYVGNDAGIFVYKVTDTRLNGVEQVTAAHETLHAAYRRLSSAERRQVDNMLMDYYEHGLNDQRIKDTIAAYKKSEPNDVVNEMHSIFATEIANLPAPLESYYARYFTDRHAVTDYTARYQGEFTSHKYQIRTYDTQLEILKQQITTAQTDLQRQKNSIDERQSALQSEREGGRIDAYNAAVPSFNQAVATYNQQLAATRNLITQYNDTVNKRNDLALETQQLTQELSSDSLPQIH